MAQSLCGVPGLINDGSTHSSTGSETTVNQGSKHNPPYCAARARVSNLTGCHPSQSGSLAQLEVLWLDGPGSIMGRGNSNIPLICIEVCRWGYKLGPGPETCWHQHCGMRDIQATVVLKDNVELPPAQRRSAVAHLERSWERMQAGDVGMG